MNDSPGEHGRLADRLLALWWETAEAGEAFGKATEALASLLRREGMWPAVAHGHELVQAVSHAEDVARRAGAVAAVAGKRLLAASRRPRGPTA